MATTCGKAARRKHGNRYACKTNTKRQNPAKIARWNELERERKQREKSANR